MKVGAFCRDIKREKRGKEEDEKRGTMAAQVCFDLASLFLAEQWARKAYIYTLKKYIYTKGIKKCRVYAGWQK